MPTRRQMIDALLRSGRASVEDLASRTGADVRTVLLDLEHVRRGLAASDRWIAHPAECRACGYVFRDRVRLATPSRCPECRSEDIADPEYEIRAD